MKVDFNKLKTDISLPDFLLNLGWKFAIGSSNSSPKMTDGRQTIVIKRNSTGQYTYWDVHSDSVRGRSVIDLMQQHIYEETGKMPTLREVGEKLQKYLNNNEVTLSRNSQFEVSNASLDESQLAFLHNQLKPYSGDFLQERGISVETLSSPVFSNVFFTYEYKKDNKIYHNTCTKLINENGFQGISQRGIRKEDGKSFKGIFGNKFRSIVVSNYNRAKPIDKVYIGESMIDCASHYQLKNQNTPLNLLYISTEGNLTQGQMELIKLLLNSQKIDMKNIYTIFDNDLPGYKYTMKLHGFLTEDTSVASRIDSMTAQEIKEKVKQMTNIELSTKNDWNDDLKENASQKKEIEIQEAVKKNDFPKLIQLKEKGYIPTPEVIKSLEQTTPANIMIAVKKIFNLKTEPIKVIPTMATLEKERREQIQSL